LASFGTATVPNPSGSDGAARGERQPGSLSEVDFVAMGSALVSIGAMMVCDVWVSIGLGFLTREFCNFYILF